jgi:hypothetical protein
MSRHWGLALLGVALSVAALCSSLSVRADAPRRERATHQYRCEQGRNVIALERPVFVSLMLAGRSYDLEWTSASTARGQGLIWRVSSGRAALTRASSGYVLASDCARVNAQI